MSLTDYICKRFAFFKFILLASAIFAQSCSNDERLEGYRLSVLEEQKFYETNKTNYRLALGKPKKNTENLEKAKKNIRKKLRTNKRPHIQRYIPILCVCAGLSLFLSISVFSFIVKPYQR